MLSKQIVLFVIFGVVFVGSNLVPEKRQTSSQLFTKLKMNESRRCQFINRDFAKLEGSWIYVLRTVSSKNTPEIRCGHMMVDEILTNGFKAHLKFIVEDGTWFRQQMTGLFIDETTVGIPEFANLFEIDEEVSAQFMVQIGICDDDSLLLIEPVYYHGGVMVFSRYVPDENDLLKLRFRTYNELRGMEHMQRISLNCSIGQKAHTHQD